MTDQRISFRPMVSIPEFRGGISTDAQYAHAVNDPRCPIGFRCALHVITRQ